MMGYNFFCPRFLKREIKKIISLKSLLKFTRNPFKCIRLNLLKILYIIKEIVLFFLINPKFKWIDQNVKGHLDFNQSRALYKFAKKVPNNGVIVEIGAFLGRSTCFIAKAIGKKNIDFYSIDTFENTGINSKHKIRNTYKLYLKNIFRYKDKIKTIKGFSYDIVKDLCNLKIDLLWVDADHSYQACKRDIEDWLPLVSKNNLLLFHDYYQYKGNIGVKKAVDEKIRNGELKKIKLVDYLLVTRKI